jgi:hypothetical protein
MTWTRRGTDRASHQIRYPPQRLTREGRWSIRTFGTDGIIGTQGGEQWEVSPILLAARDSR